MSTFVLSAFADEISPHLDEQVRVLHQHGLNHIEVRSLEGQGILDYALPQIEEIGRVLAGEGLAVSALGSPIGKTAISDPFPPHLERFKKALAAADRLHTRFIRMFSFYMPPGADPALYRVEVVRRWQQFAAEVEGTDFVLLHENERGIYGDMASRCLDLLDSLHHPQVRAVFDPANFVQCGEETYPRALEMLRQHVAYLHIKDALYKNRSVVPAGQGDGQLKEILQDLAGSGFSGFLSLEPHLAHGSQPGGGPQQFAVAVSALKAILTDIGCAPEAN